MLTSDQIRQRFLDYWKSSPRNHKEVPNVSLVPNVDSTLLFVNSGMFPLAPYLGGQPHPLGKRLVNLQRCLRTKADEIEEIGDNRHTLMFEMMGNWSLGDYFKKEQIPWMLELYVEQFELDPHRLYASVWAGDEDAPRDDETIEIWKQAFRKYGIEAEFSEDINNIPKNLEAGKTHKFRIFPYGKSDNWWERAHAPGELGGPTSEIFYDTGNVEREQDEYHINDDSGRFLEIGNSVFMQYRLDDKLQWLPLEQKNIDFGGGFERVVMCAQDKKDIFETDIFWPVIEHLQKVTGREYKPGGEVTNETRAFRVIADHGRIATFLVADGVVPSGKDQGYILRRFARRLIRYGMQLGIEQNFIAEVAKAFVDRMGDAYPHLRENEERIVEVLTKEEDTFRKTLNKGLKVTRRLSEQLEEKDITPASIDFVKTPVNIDSNEMSLGASTFYIYETYGFPFEMTLEELGIASGNAKAEQMISEFEDERLKHQEESRAGAEQKFAGGLADKSEEVVKLHTAHHLLLRALQIVLGDHVKQRGSNITGERLRIDFNHDSKLTPEQVQRVEDIVNEKIAENLPVTRVEMSREEAEKIGAQMEFGQKYPDTVSVYFIGPKKDFFSAEFCGGPHVATTGEIGAIDKKFKILKEESSGSGVRRIKASLT